MAFGFGFNKQKVLSAAEKFVQQGKLQNAITEYEKVLKADPKDLTVMNTVGDLYSRLGNSEKAVECFKSVGDAYASQGFTVKAIAMYKKLSKLKSSLECVLRLAELYTQQGLFNDARAQYLQVAEEFLREGQLEQAVRIFQKTLEMDPENVAMRTKLAEVYVRLGKKDEAWQIFAAAAETLRTKGQLAPAEEILQRMLTLDPVNSYALLLRGRNAFEAGDVAGAINYLEKVADLDSHADGLRTLLQAYLQTQKLSQAGTLAEKLLTVHNDVTAILSYIDALTLAGQFQEALRIYQQHGDRLLAASPDKILEGLHAMIGPVRENTAALELLLELLQKAGDKTHLTEVYELLAHGYVQSGSLEKARGYYLKLTQLEPENQLHARNYQQVLGRLGVATSSQLITAEEGAVWVDELEATAPFIDQRYDDEVALAVRAALTDAELFISYNMPSKALGPLLSVLPDAPRDLRINQRLAALHTRASRFTEAGVCCRTLESIYHEAGYPEEAKRYAELATRYEERAGASVSGELSARVPAAPAAEEIEVRLDEMPVTEMPAPAEVAAEAEVAELPVMVDSAPVASPAASAATPTPSLFFHKHVVSPPAELEPRAKAEPDEATAPEKEIDLSAEWEGSSGEEEVAEVVAPDPVAALSVEATAEIAEEVRFYLTNGMTDEARAGLLKLEHAGGNEATLSSLREEIAAATSKVKTDEIESVEEIPAHEIEPEEGVRVAAEVPAHPGVEETVATEARAGDLGKLVSDLESSLGEGFLPETTAHEVAPELLAGGHATATEQSPPTGTLGEFVSDLEASLGDSFLPGAPAVHQEPPVMAEAKPQAAMAAAASAQASAAAAQPATPAPTFTYQPTPIRPLGAPGPAMPKTDAAAGVDLASMFGELKQELEEDSAATDEDPETHYNLGVAFREMGLLDEAIGELQKVCQAVERGHPFPQIMQTYTWLSQCFLDKGVPEAAIRWYQKALGLPSLDEDTRTALHYELASSYETAGNRPEALSHFMEVYGSNIDYRDVAERIKTLKS